MSVLTPARFSTHHLRAYKYTQGMATPIYETALSIRLLSKANSSEHPETPDPWEGNYTYIEHRHGIFQGIIWLNKLVAHSKFSKARRKGFPGLRLLTTLFLMHRIGKAFALAEGYHGVATCSLTNLPLTYPKIEGALAGLVRTYLLGENSAGSFANDRNELCSLIGLLGLATARMQRSWLTKVDSLIF